MSLEVLPQKLFSSTNVNVIFRHNNSTIIHKCLQENLINKEMFLSSVALLFVVKGKQVISNYDGEDLIVQQGQLLYLSKDLYIVSDFIAENSDFEAVIFFFDDNFIEENVVSLSHSEKLQNRFMTLTCNKQLQNYVNSLVTVYSNSSTNRELLQLKLSELLALLALQYDGNEIITRISLTKNVKKKRDIKAFMEKNFLKNLNVEDFALLTGRSKSTFIREFKQLYDTTPIQWLINKRLAMAHNLLKSTNLNVTETALEVGYENVSHFIRAYKNKYKNTPKSSKKMVLTQIAY